jgi:glycosyltransferase involved in cell wall biosynthesis
VADPLVSVLIPAYNERYFGEAFASALAQSGLELEIVVCDDSPGDAIGRTVAAANDPRVRYVRNPSNLGFGANFTQCFSLARGAMVKFLNDDDRLRPGCVATLASVLAANPAVKLATSRRQQIDAAGNRMPDVVATMPLAHVSAILSGRELGDFVLANSMNFIGEPTTVMFRHADVSLEDGALFRWGGRDYHCLADLSLWLRLLAQGLAYYNSVPLSDFRVHAGQEQHREGVRISCIVERLWIVRQAQAHGFLASTEARRVALASVKARVTGILALPTITPSERNSLEELGVQVDGDLASLR